MPDDISPVQSKAQRDINSRALAARERRARLTVFDGIPLPIKPGGKIYGLPMKSLTLTHASEAPLAAPGLSAVGVQDHGAALGDGEVPPMNLSITTAQAAQTGLPCAY